MQLREICDRAFAERYADANGLKRRARERLDGELQLIARLGLCGFFLLHWEVLELARECALEVRGPGSPRHVLPPGRGRGSSVGSIVCYLTGLSHVDPVAAGLSLGRFINDEMVAAPDIDLDFPRDIREKLIVRVTERYGREHAALVASFATYRSRGAIRDVGKALGLPFAELERLARVTDGWDATRVGEELEGVPGDAFGPALGRVPRLTGEISGLPRHISQHPGGMVISTRPLVDLVPVQPAAMAGRQICQWDKDSCGDAGFLKIDLLGLGMLSAVEECIDRIARLHGETIDLSRIPLDDPGVFEEIQAADTVGVFQIESRAQMQSLLQTRPENLDDLTVQVALVRPGPIQGKAVHPYIEHRQRRREDPTFEPPVEHESLREPLRDTLGVVVFQDQVLDVAMAAARFTVGEAEGLRRAMSRKRSEEAIEAYRPRFVDGLPRQRDRRADRACDLRQARRLLGLRVPEVACGGVRRCSPTSRPGCVAIYPAEFLCALLNAQPMGFYPPSSLVRDAQRRGVEVCPPHVNRLGGDVLGRGRRGARGARLCAARSARRMRRRSRPASRMRISAILRVEPRCGAVRSRRSSPRAPATTGGRVASCSGGSASPPRGESARRREPPARRCRSSRPARSRSCQSRRAGSGCSPTTGTRRCRSASIRSSCCGRICRQASRRAPSCPSFRTARRSQLAGLAIARQRPSTANGIVFMLLEDEHGQANLIVPPPVYERHRAIVRGEPLLLAVGKLERHDRNINLLVVGARPHSARSPAEQQAKPRSREPCRAPTTSATADRPVCDRQVSSPRHRCLAPVGHPTPARRMSKRCALEPRCARPVEDSLHPRNSAVTVPGTGADRPICAVRRSVVAGVRVRPAPVGSLVDRPDVLRQVVGRVDETDVRERLREVAEQAPLDAGRTPPTAARGRCGRRAAARRAPAPPRSRPSISSASTSQNEHGRNAPSPPLSPSTSFCVAVR